MIVLINTMINNGSVTATPQQLVSCDFPEAPVCSAGILVTSRHKHMQNYEISAMTLTMAMAIECSESSMWS